MDLGEGAPFPRGDVDDQKPNLAREFGLERVDHSLERTAGRSAGVVNLHDDVFTLADGGEIGVLNFRVPPQPTGHQQDEDAGDGNQPTCLLAALGGLHGITGRFVLGHGNVSLAGLVDHLHTFAGPVGMHQRKTTECSSRIEDCPRSARISA